MKRIKSRKLSLNNLWDALKELIAPEPAGTSMLRPIPVRVDRRRDSHRRW